MPASAFTSYAAPYARKCSSFKPLSVNGKLLPTNISLYYMEESVLLGTKPLVDSITSSGTRVACSPYVTFVSVVSFNDVTIPAFCFWILSLHITKRTLHVGSKIWISFSRGKKNIIMFLPIEHKIPIFSPPCNILYICRYLRHCHRLLELSGQQNSFPFEH